MAQPIDAAWREFAAFGRWAWNSQKCYLPRAAWKAAKTSFPETTLGEWKTETKLLISGVDWRQLWYKAPRQYVLRKMFGVVAVAPLNVRTLMHMAYNAGQIEASGGIDKMRRLAGTIDDPQEAKAIRDVASVYASSQMGTWSAYVTDAQAAAITPDLVVQLSACRCHRRGESCRVPKAFPDGIGTQDRDGSRRRPYLGNCCRHCFRCTKTGQEGLHSNLWRFSCRQHCRRGSDHRGGRVLGPPPQEVGPDNRPRMGWKPRFAKWGLLSPTPVPWSA